MRNLLAVSALVMTSAAVMAADGIVTRVIDSDTLAIIVFPDDAPGIALVTRKRAKKGVAWDGAHVRVRGIDTPEKFHPKCEKEREFALKATKFVQSLVKPGMHVRVDNIGIGKYAGRYVADVHVQVGGGWKSLAEELIGAGFAYRYDGGKKQSWCK